MLLFAAYGAAGFAIYRFSRRVRALPAPRLPGELDAARFEPARAMLRELAEQLGLDVAGKGVTTGLTGRVDGLAIRVELLGVATEGGRKTARLAVHVHAEPPLPPRLAFHPRGTTPSTVTAPPVTVGLTAFDERYEARGTRAELVPRLVPEVRARLLEPGQPIALAWGRLTVGAEVDCAEGREALARRIREAVALAQLLGCPPEGWCARLERQAADDPLPEMRAASLEVLLEDEAWADAGARALERALRDPSPEVRLGAALVTEPPPIEVLESVVRAGDARPDYRAVALREVARLLSAEAATRLIVEHLGDGAEVVRIEAIRATLALRLDEALPALLTRVSAAAPPEIVALAPALGRFRRHETDEALLRLLERPEPEVTLAAVEALGRYGGPRAVAPLVALAARSPSPELERAIAELRRRTRLQPGALALVETTTEVGALSEATPGGALSAVEPPNEPEPSTEAQPSAPLELEP